MVDDVADVSMPEGIEVDETSAYFGITQSSDIVHQMMSMDRNQSITAFFGLVSEVVYLPTSWIDFLGYGLISRRITETLPNHRQRAV